jgi:hypothetical protein
MSGANTSTSHICLYGMDKDNVTFTLMGMIFSLLLEKKSINYKCFEM